MPIYPVNEPFRPAPKRNNLWYGEPGRDRVIVFVHGVLSDSHGCWYADPADGRPGVYWPALLQTDDRFSAYSIFLGGYKTDVNSGPYEVRDCAAELLEALETPPNSGEPAPLSRATIIFVCHSMGGIVVRYMLTAQPWKFLNKRIGLVLIASPSAGSIWADRLQLLVDYFKQEQGKDLQWGNWKLEDLDYRFELILHDRAIAGLRGAEACEHHFIARAKWLPPLDPLVSRESAGRYFGPVRMLPDTDHFTCVKPPDRDHPAYKFFVHFIGSVLDSDAPAIPIQLPRAGAEAPDKATHPVCRYLHWDLSIDAEGDAANEMEYGGIVLPEESPNLYPLALAEVQSGHTTPFELVRDERTSPGVTLETVEVGPRKFQVNVRFANRPTAANPASFCIRDYDWNAYSMNMEEYRQKAGWREDGLDFVEKAVPECWRAFTLCIQFPEQMILARSPFLEIYDYSSGDAVRNDALTEKYQGDCYFSRRLRTAVLTVRDPPAPFSYRVSWLLGESPGAKSALPPSQRQRQRIFSHKMLTLRTADADDELRRTVYSVLASIAEFVQQSVSAPLIAEDLELSLMVLDEEHPEEPAPGQGPFPVLRIVAGTHLDRPEYRDLALFVGDGNAGRAWKRRTARVFDPAEQEPKRHIYVPVARPLRHRFLISLPLIDPESNALVYAILNIGTFSAAQADLLRTLGTPEQIVRLTDAAQDYALRRLLEILKI